MQHPKTQMQKAGFRDLEKNKKIPKTEEQINNRLND